MYGFRGSGFCLRLSTPSHSGIVTPCFGLLSVIGCVFHFGAENRGQYDGIVVNIVLRPIYESHPSPGGQPRNTLDRRAVSL